MTWVPDELPSQHHHHHPPPTFYSPFHRTPTISMLYCEFCYIGHMYDEQLFAFLEPPLVGCPRMFILYIHNNPPHLKAVYSIRKLSPHHTVVIRDHNSILFTCFNVTTPDSGKFSVSCQEKPVTPMAASRKYSLQLSI
jgi:hypothetical protein